MLIEALRLVLATALLVVLPGWLLAGALWPDRSKLAGVQRVYVVLAGGVLVLMLVASVLGFLPHGDRGALQSLATGGMPNVELAMAAACLGLFWWGVRRGAFPELARRFPRLASPWASLKVGEQQP